jgi:hypothetical protein
MPENPILIADNRRRLTDRRKMFSGVPPHAFNPRFFPSINTSPSSGDAQTGQT